MVLSLEAPVRRDFGVTTGVRVLTEVLRIGIVVTVRTREWSDSEAELLESELLVVEASSPVW